VTAAAGKVLEQAMGLPEAERRLVAEALLETTEHEIDPAWRGEVLRRIEQVRCGEIQPEPWSVVRQKIAEALGR
jgi:hypothetical protein